MRSEEGGERTWGGPGEKRRGRGEGRGQGGALNSSESFQIYEKHCYEDQNVKKEIEMY